MNYGLALLWSVDMGERNNPIDTMRAKAPCLGVLAIGCQD